MRLPVFALFFATGLFAQVPGTTWENLTKEEIADAGWNLSALTEAQEFSASINTDAVMIVTRGKVLASWGAVDRKFNVHSIRKSFLSALCGLAVASGKIDLNATLAGLGIDDNPPSLTDLEKTASVHDLLKARSGIYHPALYETARMKAQRPQRHSHAPGTFWYYNNWDFNATGTIYEQANGSSIYEDFERLIARPIGMEVFSAADGSYVTGEDSIHRAYPFRMTARDLARFGLLYLREGKWGDDQIVPSQWIEDSLIAHSDAGTSGGYGYFWWICKNDQHLPNVTLPRDAYSARGAGGHYLLIIPSLDLVIVHRVNTDIDDRRVESSEFGELVRRILLARRTDSIEETDSTTGIKTLVPLLMSKHRVPGAAILQIAERQVAAEHHFGLRQTGTSIHVDKDTIFEVASMTKPIAAYAALKLVEQGKLDLDKPLNSYLPEPYLANEPLHGRITARMVLTHTGGFPNWRNDKPLHVHHEPGTAFLYSGEGFVFLQRVIEQITGLDYEAFMQQTLLRPLSMHDSSHVWQEQFTQTAAAGHDDSGRPKTNRKLYARPNAAFSLYCTPRDYAAFVLEMMNPVRTAAHSLQADTLQAILSPSSPPTGHALLLRRGQVGNGDTRYGLGWLIEPTPSGARIRHSGSNGTGFRSYVEFDPETGYGLIIMTNSTSGDDFHKELVEHIGRP